MVSKIAPAVASAAAPTTAASTPKQDFAATLDKGAKAGTKPSAGSRHTATERPSALETRAAAIEASAGTNGTKLIGQVQLAQTRLEQILKLAESGRTFTPAELLAFQAHAYRASQELDLAGKVVEKGTSAVKQTLQTQL